MMTLNASTDKNMAQYPPECRNCPAAKSEGLCGIGPDFVMSAQEVGLPITYPKGATILQKFQLPKGVHLICEGRVMLGEVSLRGRGLIARIAKPSYALGLAEAMTKSPYTFSAETLEPTKTLFITLPDFGRLRDNYPQLAECIINQISGDLSRAYSSLVRSHLYSTSQAKLARLLVEWAAEHDPTPDGIVHVHMNLTHQQIGQLIGVARETVSRTLADFREEGTLRMKGAAIEILDMFRLNTHIAQDGRNGRDGSRTETVRPTN